MIPRDAVPPVYHYGTKYIKKPGIPAEVAVAVMLDPSSAQRGGSLAPPPPTGAAHVEHRSLLAIANADPTADRLLLINRSLHYGAERMHLRVGGYAWLSANNLSSMTHMKVIAAVTHLAVLGVLSIDLLRVDGWGDGDGGRPPPGAAHAAASSSSSSSSSSSAAAAEHESIPWVQPHGWLEHPLTADELQNVQREGARLRVRLRIHVDAWEALDKFHAEKTLVLARMFEGPSMWRGALPLTCCFV
jgi:hypothetical protein